MFHLSLLAVCLLSALVSCDPNYRLNTTIIPSAYDITIRPYFNTGDAREFTFDGEVTIIFETTAETNQIKFHSEDLTYTNNDITVTGNGASIPLDTANPLEFNRNYSFAFVNLQSYLQVGVTYELKIVYQGPIREDLNGFYRNYYIEKGVKKWLGATQMEPTHARKVFPSFDEPQLKAVFNITIDRPANYKPSLSNTKLMSSQSLTGDIVREIFHPTPKMSTYLVAFLISEFEAGYYSTNETNSNEFGVFTRPEAANQTEYAADFGVRVVHALGDYFNISFYSTNDQLKLDHVALPNFRAGAMENWGLVKYREALLLYVAEESTPYYKYRVAQIIAHETTHMWFGNLVTCHWWSNTWLNEGFANYFQDYITSLIEPDVSAGNMLITGSVYSALDADEAPTSPPITNDNVFSPAEISEHFGTITYQKAGSVIRMIHHLIGDEAFKLGLHTYLTDNSFSSGYPNLMYSALQEGVNKTNSLGDYNGATVADVMGSWISQAGHPVLEVEIDYETKAVSLTQRRFYINGSHSSDELYKIPITYTTGVSPNFENTKPVFIMSEKTHTFNISENIDESHSWVIFNVQETGLYRVKYDSHALGIISNALRTENQGNIHYLSRAKIVNDYFAFYFADEISFNVLHETIEFLTIEKDFNVWFAAIRGFNKLRSTYRGSDVAADIDVYALRLLNNIIESLGYDTRDTDNFDTLKNRMQVLEFACRLGHAGCLENSAQKFRNLVENGTPVSPSLRPVSYCAGLRLGNSEDYEFLWNRMRNTNVANEARTIGEVLGCSTDVPSLQKFLVSMLEEDSPIMSQDLTVPLSGVLGNYTQVYVVVEALKQNLTLWKTIYPNMDTVYTSIAGVLRTEEEIDSFQTWLTSCEECGSAEGALRTLNNVRATISWASSHQTDVLSSLRDGAVAFTSSLTVVVLCVVALLKLY